MKRVDGQAVCKSKVQITERETSEDHDSNQEEYNTRYKTHLQSHFCLII